MGKVRTLSEMQSALDQEMGWRLKEIAVFTAGAGKNGPQRKPYIRAGVALLYAHWEGFIKNASEIYLSYIESRALPYRDLKSCFIVFGLKGKINTIVGGRRSQPNVDALDFIVARLGETAKLKISAAVDTESNLTSTVFSNIAVSLDIALTPYQTKFHMIDSSLVNRRNKVAHGEYLDIRGGDFSELVKEILFLMRHYKTDIENAASLESYKRTP